MRHLVDDLRYGLRSLLKSWGFTAVAVAMLALGIGATTTVFSIANALLFRPLNNGASGNLLRVYSREQIPGGRYRYFSYPNARDIAASRDVFDDLAAFTLDFVGVAEGEATRRVFAAYVSSNYFSVLRAPMARGRGFVAADEAEGASPVVVVSHAFWTSRGADPGLVGKTLRIGGRACTVVGIAPDGFTGTMAVMTPPVWLPLGQFPGVRLADRNAHQFVVVGHLRPGLTPASAAPALAALSRTLERAYPGENRKQGLSVGPPARIGMNARPPSDDPFAMAVFFVLAMAVVLLLVATLNLANMLLARGGLRQREIAIRRAVGAGRWTIVRLLLTEASMLSLAGGLLGIGIACWGSQLVASTVVSLLPMMGIVFDPTPDARVLGATLGFCALATMVFGLGPALSVSRADVVSALKEKGWGLAPKRGRGRQVMRNGLVVSQIALSFTLLTAGGLFFCGAWRAGSADPGFSLDNGLVATVDGSLVRYDAAQARDAVARVLDRVRGLPGVAGASLGNTTPYGERSYDKRVQRADAPPGAKGISAESRIIGAGYFRTLGVAVLRGREFTEAEATGQPSPRPVIVDTLLAQRLWPGRDPIGQHIRFSDRTPARDSAPVEYEVVGVAASIKASLFDTSPRAHVYEALGGRTVWPLTVHVRLAATGRASERSMLQAVGTAIRAADSNLPVVALKTLRAHRDTGFEMWFVRLAADVLAVLGAVALAMAGVGLYGVRAFLVGRRTREFGIRVAVGATAGDVVRLVMSEGARQAAVGLGIGLLLSAGVSQMLAGWIYGVRALEPAVFGTTVVLLTTAMLLACYVPARRATAVPPMTALRND
jgi:predicted permease